MDAAAVLRDGDILGRVLETLVAAQLRAESALAESRSRLFHLRQEQGRCEVDMVAELTGGRLIGVEIKADSAPRADSARHLRRLRDAVGDRFLAGIILHTGPRCYALDEQVRAAPISVLWS